MVYSGWKFIFFLVFGSMTSNLMCLTFSTLRSSSLWRIVTIFLLLEKAVQRPGTTSPSGPPQKWLKKISPPGGGGLNRVFTVTHSYPRNHYTQRLHSFSLEFPKLGFSSSSEQNFGIPQTQTWVPCLPHQNHEFGFSTKTFKRVPMRKCQQLICQCFFLECSSGRVI